MDTEVAWLLEDLFNSFKCKYNTILNYINKNSILLD